MGQKYRVIGIQALEDMERQIMENAKKKIKYRYASDEVRPWLESLPKVGDTIEIENAQCTGHYSELFQSWGTRDVGYTWCLHYDKFKNSKGERVVKLTLSTQQTIGRRFYSISPKVSKSYNHEL